MGQIGLTEILMVIAVILILFGADKLPELARALGKSLRDFKDAFKDGAQDSREPNYRKPQNKKIS